MSMKFFEKNFVPLKGGGSPLFRAEMGRVKGQGPGWQGGEGHHLFTAVACGITVRNRQLLAGVLDEAGKHLDEHAMFGAKAAAAVMGMNNIFYRFRHLSSNPKYGTMRTRLRMQVIGRHGTDPVDFEL